MDDKGRLCQLSSTLSPARVMGVEAKKTHFLTHLPVMSTSQFKDSLPRQSLVKWTTIFLDASRLEGTESKQMGTGKTSCQVLVAQTSSTSGRPYDGLVATKLLTQIAGFQEQVLRGTKPAEEGTLAEPDRVSEPQRGITDAAQAAVDQLARLAPLLVQRLKEAQQTMANKTSAPDSEEMVLARAAHAQVTQVVSLVVGDFIHDIDECTLRPSSYLWEFDNMLSQLPDSVATPHYMNIKKAGMRIVEDVLSALVGHVIRAQILSRPEDPIPQDTDLITALSICCVNAGRAAPSASRDELVPSVWPKFMRFANGPCDPVC